MENNKHKKFTVNPPNFKKAIKNGDELYVQFHLFSKDAEAVIIKIIHYYLAEYDILYIKNAILTVVKELLNNSVKANVKRLYFKLKELDINKTDEYRLGMETFKEEAFQEENHDLLEKLEQSNLIVRVSFKTTDKNIQINIINNISIMDSELNKISSRITKAYKYNDISEAFDDVLDESEGAGLGLIMAMMLFKNTGLAADSLKIHKKDKFTIASLKIPKKITPEISIKKIADEILEEINEIPVFPKNIKEIQKLCQDPDSTVKMIANSISRDPGLTATLMKLVNSGGYATIKKVDSIEETIKTIGRKGIDTLLLASGVHNIIDTKYKRFQVIWSDSYKRAYYAQKISIQLNNSKINETAYLAALLSDIGQIVLLSLKPELITKLKKIAGYKGIEDPNFIEEIALGQSHSSLGGLICKKWRFNDSLIKTINLHHRPHLATPKLKELVYIVYLADTFIEIEKSKGRFEIVDEDVLKYFQLKDKEAFKMLHKILMDSYDIQFSMVSRRSK